jgi:hypothetical protein
MADVTQQQVDDAKAKLLDKEWRMSHLYKIRTKDKRLVTFKRNLMQQNYTGRRTFLNAILKARQLGFTTDALIDLFDETTVTPHTVSAIVAHERDKVTKLFEIVRRAYEYMPPELKPRVSFDNRNELYFPDLDSKIFVTLDTRGETIHNLHWSEVAFTPQAEEKAAAIFASVPKGGRITLETTANGMGGFFYDEWEDNKSSFKKHFYNWLWEPQYADELTDTLDNLRLEYRTLAVRYGLMLEIEERFHLTPEQLQFYVNQVRKNKYLVLQEFPTTALEAFIATGRNIFHYTDLQKHRVTNPIDRKWGDLLIWEHAQPSSQYVIGVDPAGGIGGDSAVIEVVNAHTGEQVAEYASNYIKPNQLGLTAMEIGNMYNKALIVIESNNHGHAVIDAIRHKYWNLYRRETLDKTTREKTYTIGFQTTGTSKPLLVDRLEEAIREETIQIHSEDLIKECKTFVQTDESGKQGYGAEGSAHDDRVMAMGLAVMGIRDIPKQKMPKTQAETRLDTYIHKHGIPSYFDTEKDEQYEITGRNRPRSRMKRTSNDSIYADNYNAPYNQPIDYGDS